MPTIVFPIIVGLGIYFVVIGAIEKGLIQDELIERYVTGHSVSKVTTAMFLIGLVSLILVSADVWDQFRSLKRIHIHERRVRRSWMSRLLGRRRQPNLLENHQPSQLAESHAVRIEGETNRVQQRLSEFPRRWQNTYLWRRFRSAIGFIQQHRSANGLDDELKYLSDQDASRKNERYSFVRILIWATPMLGFLGTVLGISEALGGIKLGPESDFQGMMETLQSSLYIAFDTTALALTFSVVLMFFQFLVDRCESQLLQAVDENSRSQLTHYFPVESQEDGTPQIDAIQRIASEMMKAVEGLVEKQCSLWNHSITAAQSAWVESVTAAKQVVNSELVTALGQSTSRLAIEVSNSISKADKTLDQRIQQWHISISELTREFIRAQQDFVSGAKPLAETLQVVVDLKHIQEDLLATLHRLPNEGPLFEIAQELVFATQQLVEQMRLDVDLRQSQQAHADISTFAQGPNIITGPSSQSNEFEFGDYEKTSSEVHQQFDEDSDSPQTIKYAPDQSTATPVVPITRRLFDMKTNSATSGKGLTEKTHLVERTRAA